MPAVLPSSCTQACIHVHASHDKTYHHSRGHTIPSLVQRILPKNKSFTTAVEVNTLAHIHRRTTHREGGGGTGVTQNQPHQASENSAPLPPSPFNNTFNTKTVQQVDNSQIDFFHRAAERSQHQTNINRHLWNHRRFEKTHVHPHGNMNNPYCCVP